MVEYTTRILTATGGWVKVVGRGPTGPTGSTGPGGSGVNTGYSDMFRNTTTVITDYTTQQTDRVVFVDGSDRTITLGSGFSIGSVVTVSSLSATAYVTGAISYADKSWHSVNLPAARSWNKIIYGADKFVAVASSVATASVSATGVVWSDVALPANRVWWTGVYGFDKFVILSNGAYTGAYSTDGTVWTATNAMPINGAHGLAYGAGVFVAVKSNSITGSYSYDGITWSSMQLPVSRAWNSVTFGGDKFFALAQTTNKGAYSYDGITWSEFTLPYSITWGNGAFGYEAGVYLAMSSSVTSAYSYDGINWFSLIISSDGTNLRRAAYDNIIDRYVVVGGSVSSRVSMSLDGLNWGTQLVPEGSYNAVGAGNGVFVIAQSSATGAMRYAVTGSPPVYTVTQSSPLSFVYDGSSWHNVGMI